MGEVKEMNKYDAIKNEITEIVNEGDILLEAIRLNDKKEINDLSYFISRYEMWYTKALCIVKQLLSDRLEDFTLLYKDDKRKQLDTSTYTVSDALRGLSNSTHRYGPHTARLCVLRQINMVQSCLETFDKKIFDIQNILQADIFDSEIESAKHLLKKGFYRASGAICGVIIEKHFAGVCTDHNITVTKKNPTIADYNDVLKDNVYDTVEWRKVQYLGDIRNLCDHKKDREPTKEEVEDLIAGTERIIKTIF